ncbi:hypothetical protein ACMUMQ_06390 [Marinomonas sp. 2405UD66-6]|uniref:hypothetical protein n=1 Tax=Marinomonas sp. 2405UD66-6 TaxID=3391834 RepID=UPI0039C90773
MDTKIQFRVDKETKHIPHNDWITEQVNIAFEHLDEGTAEFVTQEEANAKMEDFKAKIRARFLLS